MIFQIKEVLSRLRLLMGEKEKGQTLIEYALLVVLIAIVVIAVLLILGPQIADVFQNISDRLSEYNT